MSIRRTLWQSALQTLTLVGLAATLGVGCGGGSDGGPSGPSLSLTSSEITDGASLSQMHAYDLGGCTGMNELPHFSWTWSPEAPPELESYAVTCLDETTPWVHFVAYDIGPAASGVGDFFPPGSHVGPNSYGGMGYGGPCPPPGETHTYAFQVWALDIADLSSVAGFDANDPDVIVAAIKAHAITSGAIRTTYARP